MSFLIDPYRFGGGASLPGAHRYWRIHITSVGSGASAAINLLEMYESELGENVANGGTATADSEFSVIDVAANAFDPLAYDGSNNNHAWSSTETALPHWLEYDFGESNDKQILSIGIVARRGDKNHQMPTDFDVQYSDNRSKWTTAWSESGVAWSSAGRELKRFTHPLESASYSGSPHGSHRYWRIAILDVESAGTAAAIGEVEMRAASSGADQCSGGTASADAVIGSGLEASKAFDNSTTTLWSSTDKGTYNYAWLEYDFGSGNDVSVAEFTIRARHDGFAYTTPKRFYIQYSDNGSAWTTAWGPDVQTGWSANETRTFTDPDYL